MVDMGSNGRTDDDEDEALQGDRRHLTPVRGLGVLDAELEHVESRVQNHERRLRHLEEWKAAVAGVQGQPGAFSVIREDIATMQVTTKSELAAHSQRLTNVEQAAFRIAAIAGACTLVGGSITALVIHLLGK